MVGLRLWRWVCGCEIVYGYGFAAVVCLWLWVCLCRWVCDCGFVLHCSGGFEFGIVYVDGGFVKLMVMVAGFIAVVNL